jgi:hypothetical protein
MEKGEIEMDSRKTLVVALATVLASGAAQSALHDRGGGMVFSSAAGPADTGCPVWRRPPRLPEKPSLP